MPDGAQLIIGDMHCWTPAISEINKHVREVSSIVLLGDIVDEREKYNMRRHFLQDILPKALRPLSRNIIIVEGNHDKVSDEYEKRYLAGEITERELYHIKKKKARGEWLDRDEFIFSQMDGERESLKRTGEMLRELGAVEDYVCITDCGEMFRGSQGKENFYETCSHDYDVYVVEPNKLPDFIVKDGCARNFYLLSHKPQISAFPYRSHRRSRGFRRHHLKYVNYFHGHWHKMYKDYDEVCISLYKPSKQGWRIFRSFSYDRCTGELEPSRRNTPSIDFFFEDSSARVGLVPGIKGDWMVLDPGKRRLVYGSRVPKKVTEIPLDGLLRDVCRKGFKNNGYQLLI